MIDFAEDSAQVKAIANQYFRRCVWEFMFGTMLSVASVSSLVLLLPFLANPVILAPVFILTCMMIPLLAHFMLISPGINDWKAARALNKSLSNAIPNGAGNPPFRDVFFKEGQGEFLKADITAQYNLFDNAPRI